MYYLRKYDMFSTFFAHVHDKIYNILVHNIHLNLALYFFMIAKVFIDSQFHILL